VSRLRVVSPGPLTLVEDLGRPGREHWGVAPSGAFDRAAHARAQRLVGNHENAAGLEVLMGGLECVAEGDVVVAATGAACPVEVAGRPEGGEVALYVRAGTRLTLRTAVAGLRAYVAVRGGLVMPPVLGSRSRDVGGGIGPAPLAAGDVLPVGDDVVGQPRYEPAPLAAAAVRGGAEEGPARPAERSPGASRAEVALGLAPGPHDDLLDDDAWRTLETAGWVVGDRSDRMGVRLGPAPGAEGWGRAWRMPGGLPSFPVLVGSVQVTPSGELVVLGPDAGVTGGYPVVGVVKQAGLDVLAQCRPGAVVGIRRRMRRSPGRGRGSV
jgi:biotin-dependent carboxylase-like uncharacterized protein